MPPSPRITIIPPVPVPASSPIPTMVPAIPVVTTSATLPPALRAQTPTPAPAPPRPPKPPKQLPPQLPPDLLHVHEIAVPAAIAAVLLELAAGGLAEVGDGGEVDDDGAAGVEAALEGLEGGVGLVLLLELDVYVADHVVGEVVADVEAFDLAEFAELLEDVLVEVLEVLLDLAGVDRLALGIDAGGDHVGALVHVGEKEGWGDGGAVVEAGAAVPVAASADLEIEGAIHAVLLCAEDRS